MVDIMTPGIHTERTATPREVLKQDAGKIELAGGVILDGSQARDPLNTGDINVLRAGMILGLHTGNLWRPSFLGVTTVAYTSGDTHIHVSAATAVEVVRRAGASGTLNITHAPTAGGTVVAYATLTYSAVDVATGIITCTNLAADVVVGSLIGPPVADLSYVPRVILNEPWGVKVTDQDGTDIDPPAGKILIGGVLDVAKIINYPAAANTTHITWLQGVLNTYGRFMFSDRYQN